MSDSHSLPSLPTSETGPGVYHDDPTMASAQGNESFETRTPSLNSPDVRGSDTARASFSSSRNSVSLIPTPETVSKRHPTYVCHRLPMKSRSVHSFMVCVGTVLIALLVCYSGVRVAWRLRDRSRGCTGNLEKQRWYILSLFDSSWYCADLIYRTKAFTSPRKMCFPSHRFSS
jgi:hypothetical protein